MKTEQLKMEEFFAAVASAEAWISTGEQAVKDDVKRLGLVEAARYNTRQAKECFAKGDGRFKGVTVAAMKAAIKSL